MIDPTSAAILLAVMIAQSPSNPSSILQLAPTGRFLSTALGNTQSFAGMDLMPNTPALFGTTKATSTFNLIEYRPHAIPWSGVDAPLDDPFSYLFSPVRNLAIASQEQFGLRWDIYDVIVYQGATTVMAGNSAAEGVNRFNLRADLKLWDFGGHATGRITAQMRQTNAFPTSSDLGTKVGSDITLDSNFTGHLGTRLVRLRYEQGLLDNRVMVSVGKINPNDYVLNNPFAGDETTQFLASIFDGSDAAQVGFQGYLLGAAVLVVPMDGVYANFVATAPSTQATNGLGADLLGTGLWWFASEVGIVTDFLGDVDSPGRYSVGFNTTNASYESTDLATARSGNGFWVMGTEYFTADVGAWAQFTYCDPSVALYKSEFTAGLSIQNCFDRKGDGFGVAWGFTTNPTGDLGVQTVTELYYRFQLTDSVQITPDIQVITNPTNPTTDTSQSDTVVVFGIRALIHF
ncbi:MAG: hypothetical protein EXS15_03065 [Phycisphaerales bacterium]|nr:hypothetical protein [Phycisphaerales bacterium]